MKSGGKDPSVSPTYLFFFLFLSRTRLRHSRHPHWGTAELAHAVGRLCASRGQWAHRLTSPWSVTHNVMFRRPRGARPLNTRRFSMCGACPHNLIDNFVQHIRCLCHGPNVHSLQFHCASTEVGARTIANPTPSVHPGVADARAQISRFEMCICIYASFSFQQSSPDRGRPISQVGCGTLDGIHIDAGFAHDVPSCIVIHL
jgi:hypothetical protein